MSKVASKAAIAGLVRALAHGADAADIEPALSILSASLHEEPLKRLIELEQKLATYPAGARALAIQRRLGISKSNYYRQRADAIERGYSVPNSGTGNC